MYHLIMTTIIWIHIHDAIDYDTRSQNRSNFVASSKSWPFWKFWNIKHSFNLTSDMKRSSQIMPTESIFMMMTSSMTSQGGLKVGPLHSFINEIITFFMITKQRGKISSLNFLCICVIRLWLQLYEYIFMTSLITSPGHKIGQIWITASIKSSKCRKCSWLSFWYIQLPV